MYKIVASDLDGTLLDSTGNISDENIKAIVELAKNGVFFVPASGRTYVEIPEKIKNIEEIRYIIYSNGAVVFDRKTGEKVSFCIPNKTACDMYNLFNEFEIHITFRHDGKSYIDRNFFGEEYFEYYNLIPEHIAVITDFAEKKDNFYDFLKSLDNIEVFALFFHDYEEKNRCKERLEKFSDLRTVEISRYNLEVCHKDAGKGNALSALCNMVGTEVKNTISMGDSGNDITMTKTAGLGLAMSNACDELKEVADKVICSNDEHAVRYVVENLKGMFD